MLRRSLHYLAPVLGIAPLALLMTIGTATAQDSSVAEPDSFTSAFRVSIVPDQVVNADGVATPGEPGASGTYDLRLNSELEVLCYDIRLTGVTPPYMSPARTSTHIHEAARGVSGPARIVFPDPTGAAGGPLTSSGCLQVPTVVGLPADGPDAGAAFSLAELEADPMAYYADVHTEAFVPGAVRGQFGRAVPTGGVATGAGGTAEQGLSSTVALGLVAASGVALAGAAVAVRRRA